jgi:hypothetical protein
MPALYDASVTTLTRALNNLVNVLEKAAAHCEAKKIEPAVLIGSRLYPDMFPLARQVMIASDIARSGTSRVAGAEWPKHEDNQATFPELIERVKMTIAHLETLKPAQFEDESRMVTFQAQGASHTMPASRYLYQRVIPNVFFHCATAYGILRHNGVELGKGDFLGPIAE